MILAFINFTLNTNITTKKRKKKKDIVAIYGSKMLEKLGILKNSDH